MIPMATINAYVSQVVGTPVAISCDLHLDRASSLDGAGALRLSGADGSILHVIHLRKEHCAEVQSLDRPRVRYAKPYLTYAGQRVDKAGWGLEVILHEAMQVSLRSNDGALVECAAWSNRWALVRLFRLRPWVARTVAAGMTWRHEQMAPSYRAIC